MTTHKSLAVHYSAGRIIMALNLSHGFETEYVFHFSLMQAIVMSDLQKFLRMKN